VRDGFLGVGDLDDGERGSERLLGHRQGVGAHADEDGGGDIALPHCLNATDRGCGAAVESVLDVLPDDRDLVGRGTGPISASSSLPTRTLLGEVADLLDERVREPTRRRRPLRG